MERSGGEQGSKKRQVGPLVPVTLSRGSSQRRLRGMLCQEVAQKSAVAHPGPTAGARGDPQHSLAVPQAPAQRRCRNILPCSHHRGRWGLLIPSAARSVGVLRASAHPESSAHHQMGPAVRCGIK